MDNVVNSSAAITKLCPELMAYFASGTRRLEVRPQTAARDCPVQARIRPGARGHLRLRAQSPARAPRIFTPASYGSAADEFWIRRGRRPDAGPALPRRHRPTRGQQRLRSVP